MDWPSVNHRAYGYRILGSKDGVVWTALRDHRTNLTIGTTSDAVSGAYRYVRVKVLSSTRGRAQIKEVRVYASGTPPMQAAYPIAAIRAARSGDTVVVGSGTYVGRLTVPDGVTVVGRHERLLAQGQARLR